MFSHLFSLTFIVNAFWILIFCMILVPVLYGTYRGAIRIISDLAAGDGAGDHKAGCAGAIALIVFLYVVGYACQGLANKFVTMPEPPSQENKNNPEQNRQYGPVLIFRKEAPLLYNYYQELGSYLNKQEQYIARLQEEHKQASTEAARDELLGMRRSAETLRNEIKNIRTHIEDIAGRVHFARYMAALGIEVNEKSLQSEVKKVTDEGADILTKQAKK